MFKTKLTKIKMLSNSKKCEVHSRKNISFVCLDKTCKSKTIYACVLCIRTTHKNCGDSTILSLETFSKLKVSPQAGFRLRPSLLNRSHSDMRRLLQQVHSALLKKKDLLLDFASLTEEDIEHNFERVSELYSNLLYYEHVLGSGEIRMGSPYQLESPQTAAKSLVQNFETDILEFVNDLMKVDPKYYELKESELEKKFSFDRDRVEVNETKKGKVLEFFSLEGGNKGNNWDVKFDEHGELGSFDDNEKEGKDHSEEIIILAKETLKDKEKYV